MRIAPESKTGLIKWIEDNFHEHVRAPETLDFNRGRRHIILYYLLSI